MKKRLFCLLLSLLMLVTVCPVAALAETLTEEPAATAAPAFARACADNGLLPCLQGERLRERSDAKLRPLHVDQKLGALAAASRGFVHGKDLRSGVGQRDMGQIQPKTGHTGFKHGCERFRIRTGGADGSVKIQHTVFLTSKIFCFYSITRFGKSAKGESASDDRMQSEARSEDTGHLLDSI